MLDVVSAYAEPVFLCGIDWRPHPRVTLHVAKGVAVTRARRLLQRALKRGGVKFRHGGGLGQSGMPGTIYARKGSAARCAEVRTTGLTWAGKPRDLKTLLPEVSVIVHNSGLGMTTTGLARGDRRCSCP